MTTHKTLRGGVIALAVGLVFAIGGCGGAGASDSGGSEASEDSGTAASAELSSDGSEQASASDSADQAGRKIDVAEVSPSQQIRTAQVTLEVKAIGEGSARVRGIAAGVGGLVQDENSTFEDPDSDGGSSVITLRVPVEKLDPAIEQLDDVGRRLDLRTSSKDVTTSIADLDSRVRSQETSVERMRVLLAEADSVKDVIAIESELSTREANLESLQAQAAAVKDKAALSTLVVTLQLASAEPVADDDSGFLAGLGAGWDALKAGTVAVLTVVGVLLPIGLALAVILVPAWFVYRRLRPAATSS
ncbi:DUF4349 domain-containing protein [Kineosporia babensis]|uniref:DUF4349 domain-containing protein n=1 Tax=Kineosporia babensis TaxID=499548 RepID=A0A9X1NI64_9ACTN|nr:DUF4349 domain-containing protein [Kineosporia babensis]MCD5314221.1 DUF4349 domain-containing protein [Kineosporia babensis]